MNFFRKEEIFCSQLYKKKERNFILKLIKMKKRITKDSGK